MDHFVCTECKGVAEAAGVCETMNCPKEGKPLTECNCSDGNHLEVIAKEGKE